MSVKVGGKGMAIITFRGRSKIFSVTELKKKMIDGGKII